MAEGQEPPPPPPPAAEPPPPGAPPEPSSDDDPKTFPAEYVKRLRDEAAASRIKATEASRELEKLRQAALTEEQRREAALTEAQKRAEQLQSELHALKIGKAVEEAAVKAGALRPHLMGALLISRLEVGDDGSPTNLDAALKALRSEAPELFNRAGPGSADAAPGARPSIGSTDMNALLRRGFGQPTG